MLHAVVESSSDMSKENWFRTLRSGRFHGQWEERYAIRTLWWEECSLSWHLYVCDVCSYLITIVIECSAIYYSPQTLTATLTM